MTFDRHQFAGSRLCRHDQFAAGLTYDQLHTSGHTIYAPGRTTRWIPAFYANDRQLRAVLAQAVIGYCFGTSRLPANLADDLNALIRIALERQAESEAGRKAWNGTMQHLAAVKEAGGYMAMLAAVSYRAWRLRWHSADVAEEMGLTVRSVTSILARLVAIAERLGFPTYKPRWVESRQPKPARKRLQCAHGGKAYCKECRREYQHDYMSLHWRRYYKPRPPRPPKVKTPKVRKRNCRYWPPERVAQLKQLRESGKTFREIASVMGLKRAEHAYFMWAAHRRLEEEFIKTVAWG